MKPKVSIIMPVLNGERYIAEAIESIAAQTYQNYELIVVDDGSTDGTKARVMAFADKVDIKYVSHAACCGIPKSMNDGIRHASGDLIAFLDHDDGWFPEFLETQAAYLEKHPDVAMVHSDFQTTDVDGNVIVASMAAYRGTTRPSGKVFPQLFMDSFIVGNSVLIRKECFTRLGLFDENLKWGDYHMWLRIARFYQVDYVGKVLTKYRQHPAQSTQSVAPNAAVPDSVGLQAIQKLLHEYPEIENELGKEEIRRRMAGLYFDLAYASWLKGGSRPARRCLAKAIGLWPSNPEYYRFYAVTYLRSSQAKIAGEMLRRVSGILWSTKSQIAKTAG